MTINTSARKMNSGKAIEVIAEEWTGYNVVFRGYNGIEEHTNRGIYQFDVVDTNTGSIRTGYAYMTDVEDYQTFGYMVLKPFAIWFE